MKQERIELRRMREYLSNCEAFENFTASRLTAKDQLLPFNEVAISTSQHGYRMTLPGNGSIRVFPDDEASEVVDSLIDLPHLTDFAAFRATCVPSISGSGHGYGPGFKQAIDLPISRGLIKAKHWLPEGIAEGHCHSLMTHIRPVLNEGRNLTQLEAWEYTPHSGLPKVLRYIHCMSTDLSKGALHMDGAIIHCSDSDLDTLLWNSEKVKGKSYKKYFRIDTEIDLSELHIIGSAFFRSGELYKDAMQVESY